MSDPIKILSEMIHKARAIVVFTGAGISTESGISDYRGKGGVWERFRPVTIQEFLASEAKRREYWRRKAELFESIRDAQPNDGHKAIVSIEQRGKLKGLITQNIDGLHQAAGSSPDKIIELHGTSLEVICLSCRDILPTEEVYQRYQQGEEIPLCRKCAGLLKPNTISFGQALDQDLLQKAFDWACECDLLLAVGSTLVVEPAASIPRVAREHGASLCILTLSETPLDDIADLKIAEPCGSVLRRVNYR